MAQIIKTDGTCINIVPKNGKEFQLEELKKVVGGFIEILRLKDERYMVVNEEGKLIGLPINLEATKIVNTEGMYAYDTIVGDVLVCDTNQIS